MAGPVVMALGPFKFEAHGFGLTDMKRKQNTSWAEIEVAARLNPLQWTGPSSETISISGVLFPAEFGGEGTLEGLRLSARIGIPQILVSSGGKVFGLQAIEKIEDDRGYMNREGAPHRIGYTLELKKIGFGFSLFSLLGAL
jgi:phage protein U